ncbi:unnamed protein product [Lathyrus oleraceus]
MVESMILKFEKYWDEYSVVLAFGAILDPRMKLDSWGYCYKVIDPPNWELKLENIKQKLYKLFAEYSISSSNASSIPPTTSSTMSTEPSLFDEIRLDRQQSSTSKRNGQSQLDMYLEEAVLDLDYTEHLDVLQWWKNTRHKFPELSVMARDLLSIPITIVASESSFSIGSRVLNKYRKRLLSENVEALFCSRNWLHAFDDDGNDDDNEDEKEGSTCSKSSSNILDLDD